MVYSALSTSTARTRRARQSWPNAGQRDYHCQRANRREVNDRIQWRHAKQHALDRPRTEVRQGQSDEDPK